MARRSILVNVSERVSESGRAKLVKTLRHSRPADSPTRACHKAGAGPFTLRAPRRSLITLGSARDAYLAVNEETQLRVAHGSRAFGRRPGLAVRVALHTCKREGKQTR